MYRIFCNGCYVFFNKEKLFSLTSCGHVYCSKCLPNGNRNNCKICKRKFARLSITKQMPEATQMLFKDLKRNILTFQKIIRFQSDQSECLITHLLKENERLKRLVSCFKKRTEFLLKNTSSTSVKRQMYTKIKQEPVDEDDAFNKNEYGSVMAQLQQQHNELVKENCLDNIDWNESMEMGDYQEKTVRFANAVTIPQVASSYKGPLQQLQQQQRSVASDVEEINMHSINKFVELNNQKAKTNGSNMESPSGWNYQQAMCRLNLGPTNKISTQMHQSTIDQYLSRTHNPINSSYFPIINQTANNTHGQTKFPSTMLTTRPIDANSLPNYH